MAFLRALFVSTAILRSMGFLMKMATMETLPC